MIGRMRLVTASLRNLAGGNEVDESLERVLSRGVRAEMAGMLLIGSFKMNLTSWLSVRMTLGPRRIELRVSTRAMSREINCNKKFPLVVSH